MAGILGALLAVGAVRIPVFRRPHLSWDLFAVALAFVVIKMSMFGWYRFND